MKFAWPTRLLVCATTILLGSHGLASPAYADLVTFNMSFPYTGQTPASNLPVATACSQRAPTARSAEQIKYA
jgi:hypothetical protein